MELASELGSSRELAAWGAVVADGRRHRAFEQWFSSVQFDGLRDGVLTLTARDEFVRDWIRAHFEAHLVGSLEAALAHRVRVLWQVNPHLVSPICPPAARTLDTEDSKRPGRLRMDERLTSADAPNGQLHQPLASPAHLGGNHLGESRALHAPYAPSAAGQAPGGVGAFPDPRGNGQPYGGHGMNGQPNAGHGTNGNDRFGYGADRVLPQDRSADSRRGDNGDSRRAEHHRSSQAQASGRAVRSAPSIANTRREQLIDKHTFRNFVVGPSNELAYAAASAAAGGGGPRYNPLFICGPTGLGKTHLMHAIALKVLEDRPDACVLYVSAERFTNQFIEALQHHNMESFRQRYRFECDLLLVDDIQFLAGREQTQEEFFHTFNALHDADKPIVVSSDKYPQDLQKMPERLISRFNSGLVADIQTPALETRVAIVRKKAALEGIPLDDDVAVLLAQTFKSNVRELEGSLIRLAAKSSLTGVPINLDFARNEISVVAQRPPEVRSVSDIQSVVCGHFRVTNTELMSKDRHKSVAFARQVAMYLCRQRLKCSFPELGRAFGNRDHTTVMSAVRKVASLRETDPDVNAHLEAIENRLCAEED